jgi:multisubunit Na+/H+ antiporter MnhF subunit
MEAAFLMIARILLIVTALLVILRALRGPSAFDRLFAIETFALVLVGWLLLDARQASGRTYLDAALGLALFSFIGTVFLAWYLGREELRDE